MTVPYAESFTLSYAETSTMLAEVERKSAEVTDWGARLMWVGILIVVVLAVYALMWRAWRRRGDRQAGLPAPAAVPEDPGPPLLTLEGRYYGSTTAGQWLDRIVAHGLGTRSTAELTLTETGLIVRRPTARDFYIPRTALRGARADQKTAGKVLPEGGLLVITWNLGDTAVDSGFRSLHQAEHDAWIAAVNRCAATSNHQEGSTK